jgi:cytochrome bd-type quinol oxidase subunit 1
MSDEHRDTGLFRFIIGVVVMMTAIGGFAALFFVKVPIENKDAMMFALGAVFQWAAGVVASEYGATTTGRKVAETAVRTMERQQIASEQPTEVQVINRPEDPVPVEPRT